MTLFTDGEATGGADRGQRRTSASLLNWGFLEGEGSEVPERLRTWAGILPRESGFELSHSGSDLHTLVWLLG